jgi:regulatory protein
VSKLGFSKKDNYSRCKNSAIYSLAMREHSRLEIKNKLKKKDFSENVDIDVLLDELEDNNYLNEERFTESFIRYRSSRGQGPVKISSELKMRGITTVQIDTAMQNAEIDWYKHASDQREKKFGLELPLEFKEKSRQMRFLQGRGFNHDMINQAINK